MKFEKFHYSAGGSWLNAHGKAHDVGKLTSWKSSASLGAWVCSFSRLYKSKMIRKMEARDE